MHDQSCLISIPYHKINCLKTTPLAAAHTHDQGDHAKKKHVTTNSNNNNNYYYYYY